MTDFTNASTLVVNDILRTFAKPFIVKTDDDGPQRVPYDDLVSDVVVANTPPHQKPKDLAFAVALELRKKNYVQFRMEPMINAFIIWEKPPVHVLLDASSMASIFTDPNVSQTCISSPIGLHG